MTATALPVLTRKDFISDQEVRWCPGCGDYSILAQTQKMMPDFGVPRENIVFISGIGCSGRLPYYMNTYGFHTIHGRAPTLATGLKAARPELMVWVITGDGDALSIGGNHVLHAMRRNVDITPGHVQQPHLRPDQGPVLAHVGVRQEDQVDARRARSTRPSMPLSRRAHRRGDLRGALRGHASRSTSRRRSIAAGNHHGSAFVEVLQNCNIFNDGAWRAFTDKDVRDDRMLILKHGEPMVFGKDARQGHPHRTGCTPEVVQLGGWRHRVADLLVHDETDPTLAYMLSRMFYAGVPGAGRRPPTDARDRPTTSWSRPRSTTPIAKHGQGDLPKLLFAGETWTVS